jgi:DNA-binding CsgD family transcriptional regulator
MDPKYEDDRKMISRIIMDFKKGSQALNKSEFEKLFIETDEDFYKKLLDKYPSLTKNELRLCVFLRQNLSSKEISAITQQSPHSIVVARSRLRKKLGLEESQSISNFLIQF